MTTHNRNDFETVTRAALASATGGRNFKQSPATDSELATIDRAMNDSNHDWMGSPTEEILDRFPKGLTPLPHPQNNRISDHDFERMFGDQQDGR